MINEFRYLEKRELMQMLFQYSRLLGGRQKFLIQQAIMEKQVVTNNIRVLAVA